MLFAIKNGRKNAGKIIVWRCCHGNVYKHVDWITHFQRNFKRVEFVLTKLEAKRLDDFVDAVVIHLFKLID